MLENRANYAHAEESVANWRL